MRRPYVPEALGFVKVMFMGEACLERLGESAKRSAAVFCFARSSALLIILASDCGALRSVSKSSAASSSLCNSGAICGGAGEIVEGLPKESQQLPTFLYPFQLLPGN